MFGFKQRHSKTVGQNHQQLYGVEILSASRLETELVLILTLEHKTDNISETTYRSFEIRKCTLQDEFKNPVFFFNVILKAVIINCAEVLLSFRLKIRLSLWMEFSGTLLYHPGMFLAFVNSSRGISFTFLPIATFFKLLTFL